MATRRGKNGESVCKNDVCMLECSHWNLNVPVFCHMSSVQIDTVAFWFHDKAKKNNIGGSNCGYPGRAPSSRCQQPQACTSATRLSLFHCRTVPPVKVLCFMKAEFLRNRS